MQQKSKHIFAVSAFFEHFQLLDNASPKFSDSNKFTESMFSRSAPNYCKRWFTYKSKKIYNLYVFKYLIKYKPLYIYIYIYIIYVFIYTEYIYRIYIYYIYIYIYLYIYTHTKCAYMKQESHANVGLQWKEVLIFISFEKDNNKIDKYFFIFDFYSLKLT